MGFQPLRNVPNFRAHGVSQLLIGGDGIADLLQCQMIGGLQLVPEKVDAGVTHILVGGQSLQAGGHVSAYARTEIPGHSIHQIWDRIKVMMNCASRQLTAPRYLNKGGAVKAELSERANCGIYQFGTGSRDTFFVFHAFSLAIFFQWFALS